LNGADITLKVLVAIVLLASAPLALKRRWRLFLALPLSVFQGFVPWSEVAGVPIPLAFWGGLMLWPDLIWEFKNVVSWKLTACVVGIVVLYALSILGSPDRKLGLQPIGYFLQFLVIFSAVVAEGRHDQKIILRLLVVTVAFGLVQAVAVVAFRIMPGLKLGFYLSSVSRWFISPNSLDRLFTVAQNNVLDPAKSGGLIITDANDGSAILGVLAFIALGLALQLRKRWLGVACMVLLGAIVFTGSKAGVVTAVVLPVIALHMISLRYRAWRNRLRMTMIAIMVAGALVWLGPKAIEVGDSSSYRALSAFLSRSDATLSIREKIWSYGLQAFVQQPFLGQGFGGWQLGFTRYAYKVGLYADFPPHNTYIYLWSQGGLLAALLGLAFTFAVLRFGLRQMREPRSQAFGLNLAMTMAFLWTFVHGMGNNTGLLGEMHMSSVLASLLALGYVHRRAFAAAESNAWSPPQTRALAGAASATPV
jgi:O-antigen ligase